MKPVQSSDAQVFDTFSVQNFLYQGDDLSPIVNTFNTEITAGLAFVS
jgi:hypothetical protein